MVNSATNITTTFNNGDTYTTRLVGTDPDGDIALIKMDSDLEENLTPVTFSNSSNLKVDDPVLAIDIHID